MSTIIYPKLDEMNAELEEEDEDVFDGEDDGDALTPLMNQYEASQSKTKTPSFNDIAFRFPSVVQQGGPRNSKEVQDVRMDVPTVTTFLSVPTNAVSFPSPLPSPIYSTSTPMGMPLNFFGKVQYSA